MSEQAQPSEYYIETQEDFEQVCERLSTSPALALDTEFERRNTYYPLLALLQIADDQHSILIDPLRINDWTPLQRLFAGDTLFVMHSCSEDLEVFRKHIGTQPKKLVDTQIACAFLGKGDALGYANMVLALRGIEIDKSETRSDWMQRPLTESQKAYAREDVRWLLGIYRQLEAELDQCDRLNWVQEESANLRDKYWQEPDISTQWLRMKGLGRVDQRSWPLVCALAGWREECSRRMDKPRGWIMKDPELLEIAQRRPRTRQQLTRVNGVTPTTLKRNSARVLALTNTDDLPQPDLTPMPELTNQERTLLKQCQKLVNDRAEQQQLSARFIANKQDLSELIHLSAGRTERPSALKSGWRFDFIGRELTELVARAEINSTMSSEDWILCQVYKSGPNEETYLFVDREQGLELLPEELKSRFQKPIPVTQFKLAPDRKMARANPVAVIQAIRKNGFYLQLPPAKDPSLMAMVAKNDKLSI